MYRIKPDAYSSVFVIPTDISDKHLRMAGKAQLKVLLWLFRNSANGDIEAISKGTGVPKDEIDDAMLYWIEAGIIEKDGMASYTPIIEKAEEVKAVPTSVTQYKVIEKIPEPEPPKAEKPLITKPSITQIAARMNESEDVRSMFTEAQGLFGRTLGYDGQSNLLLLHDYYGLPSEVIIILCGYAKTIGKQGSMNYITKMGVSWANDEIDTFEKATAKIARLESASQMWHDVSEMIGLENPKPTSKQTALLEIWKNDFNYGVDMIYEAYERTANKIGKVSFGYMNKILSSWHEQGFTTPADVEKSESEFIAEKDSKNSKTKSKQKNDSDYTPPSYDIELAMKRSLALDPTKTKRGQ